MTSGDFLSLHPSRAHRRTLRTELGVLELDESGLRSAANAVR